MRERTRSFQGTTSYLLVPLKTDHIPRRAILESLGLRVPANLAVLGESLADGVGIGSRGFLSHGVSTGGTEKTTSECDAEGERRTRPLNPVLSVP